MEKRNISFRRERTLVLDYLERSFVLQCLVYRSEIRICTDVLRGRLQSIQSGTCPVQSTSISIGKFSLSHFRMYQICFRASV